MWSKRDGFPGNDYFAALDPRLADVVDTKMSRDIAVMGERAGGLTDEAAAWTGLRPGTAVAVANVDAHVAVPASTVTEPGRMVMIMGTCTCHMVLAPDEHLVPGICGYVEDGILPGLLRLRGRPELRRRPLRLVRRARGPRALPAEARERGIDIHALLQEQAAALAAGRVRPARARLVERQPLGPRRRRSSAGCSSARRSRRRRPRSTARSSRRRPSARA